ncbi:hypothetical protein [Actinomyces ruminicola]|uniref:Uncharacterized protein n=1 Tax=Actinomyces ruminicola TaxID=332524 RepID=A0A1G9ZI74_9ACTO|nr:hypothetical protein [Actinomyces ruminicola]SDN21050.1 hypothetical protein SAMN04487766_1183 [Actinomyces ruminicola]
MVANLKREALERLSEHASKKNGELGFATNIPFLQLSPWTRSPGQEYSSAVNSSDTWTGPLADSSAEDTKTDVDAVDKIFSNLLDTINAEKNSLLDDVDETDPNAHWPNEY